MVKCCGSKELSIEMVSVKPSKPNVLCSKSVVYGTIITALAIATLGLLALIGYLYPSSALGILGESFGQVGAYATVAAGLISFVATVIARYCYHMSLEAANQASERLVTSSTSM